MDVIDKTIKSMPRRIDIREEEKSINLKGESLKTDYVNNTGVHLINNGVTNESLFELLHEKRIFGF